MVDPIKIDQRYEVIKSLGGGFSGEVLLIKDPEGNEAALKFLKKVQLNVSRDDALHNFKNEFAILKELNHPNISRILDFGFETRMNKYYFTTEFIRGQEFHLACENQSIEMCEKLIVQVLRALQYLHSRSIFHFDIKPQNILVHMENGIPTTPKIIDFGLAGFSSPQKKVGTPAYMAPEVIQGGLLDGRTDLYSLGVLIYKILTKTNPFAGKNLKETLDNQLKIKARPASEINPEVPKYWDHILDRLLEKNPAHRYSQAAHVIRDLNFISGKEYEYETKDTKLSYLPEKGTLIGRELEWQVFTTLFNQVFASENQNDNKVLIVEGRKGTGKTRLLAEMKHFAQLHNVHVKTLRQFESEVHDGAFLLLIDHNQVSADRVNTLIQELHDNRCLLIWATEEAPKNWEKSTVILLNNYTKEQLKLYIESVTGLSAAPQDLINEVYKRTQGNPLFVTEFIKSLLNQNMLFGSGGKWDAQTFEDIKIDFSKIHIPSSVEESLSTKFLSLPKEQQEVLQWIAINREPIGEHHLKNILNEEQLKQLKILESQDVLECNSQSRECLFKNMLFGDVVYRQIPKENIEAYHDVLAQSFENDKDHIKQFLFHKGHGSNKMTAIDALFDLGQLYLKEPQFELAIKSFLRVLKISKDPLGKTEIKTRLKLGRAYVFSRQYAQAIEVYLNLKTDVASNTKTQDIDTLLKAYDRLTDSYIKNGELDKATATCTEATEIINKAPEKMASAITFKNYRSYILLKQGKIAEAELLAYEAHQTWKNELTETEQREVSNNRLMEIHIVKQEYEKAAEICRQNINILKSSENKYFLAFNHYALGDVLYRMNSKEKLENSKSILEESILHFQHCEEISREINDYGLMMRAFNGLGNLYVGEKELGKALEYYNRALTISRQINELFLAALIAYNIGMIYSKDSHKTKESYPYFIYAVNTLENLSGRASPHVQLNTFLSYLGLTDTYNHTKEASKSHQILDKIHETYANNAIYQSMTYWFEMRRAQAFLAEENKEQGEIHLKNAEALAKSEDEKDDYRQFLLTLSSPESASVEANRGIKIMTIENSLSQTGTDDLKKIIEINQFINSEYNTDQLLKVVLNYAIKLSNAEAGFVLLLDEDGGFTVKTSMNTSEADQEKISMSIAKMAIEKGEIISSSDALSDDRFDSSESIVMNELKSVLCLPIKSKNKSIGVFYLDNRFRVNAFDVCNVVLLNAFCDQVGIALENNKLIHELLNAKKSLQDELKQTNEELAEVKDILKAESESYKTKYAYKQILSRSAPMQDIFRLLDKVTETMLTVFILGESGTGKELVAKALHYNNPTRSSKRFVAINCGAIPANLMESELFGYRAGSFTGANKDKKGLFEEANHGTLFFDEIGELDPLLQVKLLRVLQEGEVQRIGDSQAIKIDVRIVCASHKDLQDLVKQGKFREDLFYRLCQMKIVVPSLRNRSEDVPMLAKHFVDKFKEQNKLKDDISIPPAFMKALLEYKWPGNVRELENLISVACALRDNNHLSLENIPPDYGIRQVAVTSQLVTSNLADISMASVSNIKIDEKNYFDPAKTWQNYESILIAKCYEAHDKKKMPTADCLDLSHSTVYKKIADLELDDSSNPLYAENFVYNKDLRMRDYTLKIFEAALAYHGNHPYAAIRQLAVSQGYFYKMMKEFKGKEMELA